VANLMRRSRERGHLWIGGYLLVVAVYGFAGAVIGLVGDLGRAKWAVLIYFLVVSPFVLVLLTLWLTKPKAQAGDTGESQRALRIAAALGAASARHAVSGAYVDHDQVKDLVLEGFRRVSESAGRRQKALLWVDDNLHAVHDEVEAFKALGIPVSTTACTDDAMDLLRNRGNDFGVVVSDVEREANSHAGLDLLIELRKAQSSVPFFFYDSNSSKLTRKILEGHGARDYKGDPLALYESVIDVLL
jgi:hypothetical protein